MDPDFVVKVKCTIFWLSRGLRVYLDLYGGLRAEVLVISSLFIYQARESSLVPVGFLTAQFLQKV